MLSLYAYRCHWLGNVRGDLLSGLVVALALIPEAIVFSIIVSVDPKVGLYASVSIAVVTAIAGGRPGMMSAATAATAVLMVTLVRDHGLEYLLPMTMLAGLLEIAAGSCQANTFTLAKTRSAHADLRQPDGRSLRNTFSNVGYHLKIRTLSRPAPRG